jgi:hypothetical protein
VKGARLAVLSLHRGWLSPYQTTRYVMRALERRESEGTERESSDSVASVRVLSGTALEIRDASLDYPPMGWFAPVATSSDHTRCADNRGHRCLLHRSPAHRGRKG